MGWSITTVGCNSGESTLLWRAWKRTQACISGHLSALYRTSSDTVVLFFSQVHLGTRISLGYTEGADLDTTLTLCRLSVLKNKLLFLSIRHRNHSEPLWKTGDADGAFWIIYRSRFQRRTHHDFFAFFVWSGAFFFFVRKLFSGCYTLWKVLLEVTVELLFCGLLFNGFKKKQHSQFSFLLSLLWMLRFLLDFEPKNTLLSSMCYGEEGNKKLKGCDVSCSTSSIAHKHIFPLPHGINWRFTTWKDVKIVFEKASLCCCFFILDHRISKLWKIY